MLNDSEIFLQYVQKELARKIIPGQNQKEHQLRKILKRNKKYFKVEGKNDPSQLHKYVEMLVKDIYNYLPTDISKEIKSKVAIGCLETGEVNASCMKEKDKEAYAIIINQGLMLYLNKLIKFSIGGNNLKEIEYCNRVSVSELTAEIMIGYINELAEIYKSFQVPYGPIIILKPPLQSTQSHYLYVSELFVLCHELGHYFNGDMRNKRDLTNLFSIENVELLEENKSHQKETMADIKGFELLTKILAQKGINKSEKILPCLVLLFNGLYLINPNSSEKYPSPIDRLIKITEVFYGVDLSKRLKESYTNHELLKDKNFFKV